MPEVSQSAAAPQAKTEAGVAEAVQAPPSEPAQQTTAADLRTAIEADLRVELKGRKAKTVKDAEIIEAPPAQVPPAAAPSPTLKYVNDTASDGAEQLLTGKTKPVTKPAIDNPVTAPMAAASSLPRAAPKGPCERK